MGYEEEPEWGPELARRRVGTDALTAATAGYDVCAGPLGPRERHGCCCPVLEVALYLADHLG